MTQGDTADRYYVISVALSLVSHSLAAGLILFHSAAGDRASPACKERWLQGSREVCGAHWRTLACFLPDTAVSSAQKPWLLVSRWSPQSVFDPVPVDWGAEASEGRLCPAGPPLSGSWDQGKGTEQQRNFPERVPHLEILGTLLNSFLTTEEGKLSV